MKANDLNNLKRLVDVKKSNVQPMEIDIDPDFDLELELDDAPVQIIDGVLIKGDEEEVKMLFYHYKPDGIDLDEEKIRCKGIAEFRTSRSTFNEIAKNFKTNIETLDKNQRRIDEYIIMEKNPMYI